MKRHDGEPARRLAQARSSPGGPVAEKTLFVEACGTHGDPISEWRQERRCARLEVEAVNPEDGSEWTFLISYDRLRFLGRASRGHVMEAAYCLRSVLRRPTASYRGLLREEDQARSGCGWLCYCGQPERGYLEDGTEIPPPEGLVFLAFVTDENVVYNWRWEKADPHDPSLPREREPERFKERVL